MCQLIHHGAKPIRFDVSTPPRLRWKEVESNTDVVPLISDSDDVAPNVATIKIEFAKGKCS